MKYEFEMGFNNGAIIKNQQSFICHDPPEKMWTVRFQLKQGERTLLKLK